VFGIHPEGAEAFQKCRFSRLGFLEIDMFLGDYRDLQMGAMLELRCSGAKGGFEPQFFCRRK